MTRTSRFLIDLANRELLDLSVITVPVRPTAPISQPRSGHPRRHAER